RITLNNATSITPVAPARTPNRTVTTRGSKFDENLYLNWLNIQWYSTAILQTAPLWIFRPAKM
ncbi:MAG: hypothetical protein P4L92_05050, partial [Rudaea sp.]|nr:hypothetical protein [Rudaea sp.]